MSSLNQRPCLFLSRKSAPRSRLFALALWLSVAFPLVALGAWGDDLKFDIETISIRATQDNTKVDPKLQKIADSLRKQFRYTGFKIEKESNCKVDEAGENCKHDMGCKYEARVKYLGVDDKGMVKLEICVTYRDESKLTSTVTVTPGKTALFGGWDLPGGDKLIIAVRPTKRD